jgi:hypothetical protein
MLTLMFVYKEMALGERINFITLFMNIICSRNNDLAFKIVFNFIKNKLVLFSCETQTFV